MVITCITQYRQSCKISTIGLSPVLIKVYKSCSIHRCFYIVRIASVMLQFLLRNSWWYNTALYALPSSNSCNSYRCSRNIEVIRDYHLKNSICEIEYLVISLVSLESCIDSCIYLSETYICCN